jgi:hypothetical protein
MQSKQFELSQVCSSKVTFMSKISEETNLTFLFYKFQKGILWFPAHGSLNQHDLQTKILLSKLGRYADDMSYVVSPLKREFSS